jgi:NAD(P)H-flavin reductase
MITAIKEFGSYKLTRATDTLKSLYDNDNVNNNNDSEYVSTCSIKNNWIELELLNITVYNDDTSIFRFQLPNNEKNLNLPVGGFLLVLASDCEHDGGGAIRPYTSISPELGLGYFEIIVKRYQQTPWSSI